LLRRNLVKSTHLRIYASTHLRIYASTHLRIYASTHQRINILNAREFVFLKMQAG
jgi:hypothetical protein